MRQVESIFVTIFYILIVVLAMCFLAAVQLRSSSGAAYDTWRLNHDANRYLLFKLGKELDDSRKDLARDQDRLNFTKLCLKLYNDKGEPNPEATQRTQEEVNLIKKSKEDYWDISPGDAKCMSRGYVTLLWDADYYVDEIAYRKGKGIDKRIETDIANLNQQYLKLIDGKQEFLALKEIESAPYMKMFVVITYDFLVLGLVLLMGALGGMVRILREYCDAKTDIPLRDYLTWPLIGAVVAIGGYVLAKTGLVLLSSTGGDLSPFMVGLIGIVSGLLAKEMIDRIARVGKNMLDDKSDKSAA